MAYTARVNRTIKFVEQLIVPSGKGAGKPFRLRKFEKDFIRDVYGPTVKSGDEFIRLVRRAILSLARKNGKSVLIACLALVHLVGPEAVSNGEIYSAAPIALDTPIPTESGWTTMGNIRIGDKIFDEKGATRSVIGVSDIFWDRECYAVSFNDGNKIVADADHLWTVDSRWLGISKVGIKRGIKPRLNRTLSTKEIKDTLRLPWENQQKKKGANHRIPAICPLDLPRKELSIQPYTLGAWLGDGRKDGGQITIHPSDSGIAERIQMDGYELSQHSKDHLMRFTVLGLRTKLRELSLLKNKHIPIDFLRASIEQRLDLLRGLMDTDGTCTKMGELRFANRNEKLATDVYDLVATLGIIPNIHSVTELNKPMWIISFRANRTPLFNLKRKIERQKIPTQRARVRHIVDVKKVKSVPVRCISTNSPSKLFLVSSGLIATHNTEREQAGIIFKYAAQIVRADPELESFIKIVESTKTMVCFGNGSVYRALSAEAGTKYGLNPTMVIYDELAQARNRDLYDALDTSMSTRPEPLYVVISTQSNDPQHILSQLIDDGLSGNDPTTVCHLYAVPDDAGNIFTDQKLWKLANPALGDFRSLSEMKIAAKRAQRMPSFESSFRNLYLNQRIDAKSPLIPRAEWEGCRGEEIMEPGSEIYLALDLSGKIDLASLVATSAGDKDIVKPWFWKPEDSLREHEKRDRVPYYTWKQLGVIETSPGRAVNYDFIVTRLQEILRTYTVLGMAYDRWHIDDFLNAANRLGLDAYVEGKDTARPEALRLVKWGQGWREMGPAIDALEVSILERKLIHDGNPCLTWNISNAVSVSDPAGNRKFDKSKIRFRIDGAVALAMAIGLKYRDLVKPVEPSVYDGADIETINKRMAF